MTTHFQREKCHFRNNQGRDLDPLAERDTTLMVKIRRVTLDVFWSRGAGNIRGYLNTVKRLRKVAR